MKITQYGQTYEVTAKRTRYMNNGNLAIILTCEDGTAYGNLTVNLTNYSLPEDMAYVDTNNMPQAEEFIKANGLGLPQHETMQCYSRYYDASA